MGFLLPSGVTSYLAGGLSLGLGLMVMNLTLGVKAGASSVLSSTLTYFMPLTAERSSRQWRLLFALAMVLGVWLYAATHQAFFVTAEGWWRLALGGLLVGFGTRLSSGCTSGQGICGVASFSRASLLAVAVFMALATIGFRLAPRLRQTTLLGLPFSHEVKPMLIGLAGMLVGAYLQGVLAEGRTRVQG